MAVEKELMVLVRIMEDSNAEAIEAGVSLTEAVPTGTYVGAVVYDGTAYYWHPETGEPWESKAGDFIIQTTYEGEFNHG